MNLPTGSAETAFPEDDRASHQAAKLPDQMTGGAFGTLLEPVLRKACRECLSEVTWFRTDWQRGGALTGYANWTEADQTRPVFVKLPVPPCEQHWLLVLQDAEDVVPSLYAYGDSLGGYDLAWIVLERLEHGPLGSAWGGAAFDLLVEAAGRFYKAAHSHPCHGQLLAENWAERWQQSWEAVRNGAMVDDYRWKRALKKAHRKLTQWVRVWEQRPTDYWCHGDLHLGNAMTRQAPPAGPALLLDFAKTRVGHWVQDAVYFEHLYWSRRNQLGGRKLCSAVAHERKRHSLPVDRDWPRYATIRRAMLALSTPAMLRFAGDRAHVAAALEVLEREVG